MESHLVFPFRPYQRAALAVMDYFYRLDPADPLKQALVERLDGQALPFYGFEMATGSGKTLLIAAVIVYLARYHQLRDFLVLTPPSTTIYHKTIREFDPASPACLFQDANRDRYNLVTGENYFDRRLEFDPEAEFTIYVFNISKYFASRKHQKSVDKAWEEGPWRDARGNVISMREYLRGRPDLTIITDEAHHFQKFTKRGKRTRSRRGNSSGDVIVDLVPGRVVEFTATMVRDPKTRRVQTAIYRYPLERYISDGYGKRVRAWGIPRHELALLAEEDSASGDVGDVRRGERWDAPREEDPDGVTPFDQLLVAHALAVHLVKRKALGYGAAGKNGPDKTPRAENDAGGAPKPLLLVRTRGLRHMENLYQYLHALRDHRAFLARVWRGWKDQPESLVATHLGELSFETFFRAVTSLARQSFFIHYKNRSDPVVQETFEDVEHNAVEIVIQRDVATEGWNVDNVYTVLILDRGAREVRTYIKQLIGRGLRLFKEQREYDDLPPRDPRAQAEILHVVCDRGSGFKKFVAEIERVRSELGVPAPFLGIESPAGTGSSLGAESGQAPPPEPATARRARELREFLAADQVVTGASPVNYNEHLLAHLAGNALDLEALLVRTTGTRGEVRLNYPPLERSRVVGVLGYHEPEPGGVGTEMDYCPLELRAREVTRVVHALVERVPALPSAPRIVEALTNFVRRSLPERISFPSVAGGKDRGAFVHRLQRDLVARAEQFLQAWERDILEVAP